MFHDDGNSSVNLATFHKSFQGGLNLFQSVVDPVPSDDTKLFNKFNIFSPEHSLRESVKKFILTDDPSELQHYLVGVFLHQMSAKVGLKKHGQRAKEILFTEFL